MASVRVGFQKGVLRVANGVGASAAARKEKISRLSESWVTTDRQAQYLALLNEFEKK